MQDEGDRWATSPDVTVIPGGALTPEFAQTWSELQASDPLLASPYFTADFFALCASGRNDVFVGILRREGKAVGFFPFQIGAGGVGEPLAHPASDFHGLVSAPGVRVEAAALVHGCKLKSWTFHHLISHQETFRPFHQSTRASHYLDLSHGFESYALRRSESGTRQFRQIYASRRRLESELGEMRVVLRSGDPDVLDRLRRWKEERFRSRGIRKPFSDQFWTFLQRLAMTETEEFAGMLSVLVAGGEAIAAHLGMRSRTRWHYWYPAFDPRFARFQPGLILLMEMARQANSLGLSRIDLGTGEELYKARLADDYEEVAKGRVEL